MQIHATWTSGMRFEARNQDGLGVVMDVHPDQDRVAGGPTPMETLLMALAGCTGMDVIPILKKMRAPVERFAIEVTADRAESHPRVLTAIRVRFSAAGPGLRREQVEKAVALSQEKYCSVSAMLRKAAPVTYDTIVIDTNVVRQGLALGRAG